MFDEKKVVYTVTLVDPEYPNLDNEDFIRDIMLIDGKIIITWDDSRDDHAVDKDLQCIVTPYTKYEVRTVQDLKEAIGKKRVVEDHGGEDGLIVSELSDEDSFMSIFGEESLDEIGYKGLVYLVKGKSKKMKIEKFYEEYMD